ncbi:MAG: Rho termination factor N-terminal domain-containing protein [Cyanobacteria bacterium P01_A01_bin.123]
MDTSGLCCKNRVSIVIKDEQRGPDFRWCNIPQLKAIASLYRVPKYNRLRKAELVAALSG